MSDFKPLSCCPYRPFARYGQEIANVIPIHHLRSAYSVMSDRGFLQWCQGLILASPVKIRTTLTRAEHSADASAGTLNQASNGSEARGIGIARNTSFFRCLSVSKMIASSATSIRFAVRAKTSDMRAPANAIVRQNVDVGVAASEAVYTKAAVAITGTDRPYTAHRRHASALTIRQK